MPPLKGLQQAGACPGKRARAMEGDMRAVSEAGPIVPGTRETRVGHEHCLPCGQ